MVGIKSFGAYIPYFRLERVKLTEAFGEFWPTGPGERSVASFDEDSVSMAANAALDCMVGIQPESIDGVFFATTSAPYKEKLSATTIATVSDLKNQVRTVDFTDSLRAGSNALQAAVDAVKGGAGPIMVCMSDCRMAAAQGALEQMSGDAAAAFLIGKDDVIASIEDSYNVSEDFYDQWRSDGDIFVRAWEERFVVNEGYNRLVSMAVKGIMDKTGYKTRDFNKLVMYGVNPRHHMSLAMKMGFDAQQLQDTLFFSVGCSGVAAAPLMLVNALQEANPGDLILFVTYGEGSTATVIKVTESVKGLPERRGVSGYLFSKNNDINYNTYLRLRNMMPLDPGRRPERDRPSMPAVWRNSHQNLSLCGSRCRVCGTPQFPRQRVCVNCQAKDQMEPYRFANKRGRIKTFTLDYLAPSPVPPTVIAVVDFEDGGRMLCEMSDCDPSSVQIGMEVEMNVRKLYDTNGVSVYFWKARPIR